MLPKVKQALRKAVEDKMEKQQLNWFTLQKIGIKKAWGFPCGHATLHKVVKQDNYVNTKQTKKCLEYFNIPYNENYGIITLAEEQDYESAND